MPNYEVATVVTVHNAADLFVTHWLHKPRYGAGRSGTFVIATCAAARRRSGVPCGRTFVPTRADQEYCSSQCQARMATRRFRA